MKNFRASRRSLLVIASVGLLVACCTTGCSSAAGDGVTTLKFMQNKREVVQYFDGVISQFEAQNPDIRVVQDFNEANFVPGLIRYANNHELLAMAAPKPVLIIAASQDQSFPLGGVREGRAVSRPGQGATRPPGRTTFTRKR